MKSMKRLIVGFMRFSQSQWPERSVLQEVQHGWLSCSGQLKLPLIMLDL
tara:strand:+ start:1829 stop:1975 length:147 start_codon:yes stop_codon:yes gene_type:complete